MDMAPEAALPLVSAGAGLTGTPGTLARTKSIEALGIEGKLDKFASWVKDVERESNRAERRVGIADTRHGAGCTSGPS